MCHEKPMNIIKLLNVLRNYQLSINILGSLYTVEQMHKHKTHEGTNNIWGQDLSGFQQNVYIY